MKKQQIEGENTRSLKKVIIFCVIVAGLILLSLLLRFIVVIQHSKFDGTNRFTLAIVEDKKFRLLSFDPASTTISLLVVSGNNSNELPQRVIGIPVDGTIRVTHTFALAPDPADGLMAVMMHPIETSKDITGVDLVRLYFFAKTISTKNTHSEQLVLPHSESDINKIATQLFADNKILDDNVSIEIVNGAGISGMAKRLERMLDNSGANVVAVSSSHRLEKTSKIYYYQKTSYTVDRLEHMLGYPLVLTNQQGIAEIKIILGEDQIKTTKY